MKLNVGERYAAMKVVSPLVGNYATLRIVRVLLEEKLGFTEAEEKEYKIVVDKRGMASWGKNGFEEIEIDLTDKEKQIIKSQLEQFNNQNKLEQTMFSIYEKFVIGDNDGETSKE